MKQIKRNISLMMSTTQNVHILSDVEVSTLGKLKLEMAKRDINYNNMDFFEGNTRVKYTNDDSVFPNEVTLKGVKSSDLFFVLSTTNKKLESGADRAAVYAQIKKFMCEDEKRAKNHFNKDRNYTQKSTDVLGVLIVKYLQNDNKRKAVQPKKSTPVTKVVKTTKAKVTKTSKPKYTESIVKEFFKGFNL